MEDHSIVDAAREGLAELADPSKAGPMAAYMKTAMPFYGVQKKGRTAVLRTLVREFAPDSHPTYEAYVRALWDQPHREEKYLAIGYARAWKEFINFDSLPLYRDLIVEGAWWDLVDEVAVQLIGVVVMADRRDTEPVVRSWIEHEDAWLRRSSIICQIKAKERTDTRLLADACHANFADTDFFIRKAIGWALREFAKTDAEWVRSFVAANQSAMASLSVREARKHLS